VRGQRLSGLCEGDPSHDYGSQDGDRVSAFAASPLRRDWVFAASLLRRDRSSYRRARRNGGATGGAHVLMKATSVPQAC
jgi:hypothetical protein